MFMIKILLRWEMKDRESWYSHDFCLLSQTLLVSCLAIVTVTRLFPTVAQEWFSNANMSCNSSIETHAGFLSRVRSQPSGQPGSGCSPPHHQLAPAVPKHSPSSPSSARCFILHMLTPAASVTSASCAPLITTGHIYLCPHACQLTSTLQEGSVPVCTEVSEI